MEEEDGNDLRSYSCRTRRELLLGLPGRKRCRAVQVRKKDELVRGYSGKIEATTP